MRLSCFAPAVVLLAVSTISYATPISKGETVTPSSGTYGGTLETTHSGTNNAGTVSYTDSVYADPSNPICSGCYDFVIQVSDSTPGVVVSSVSTSDFSGYSLQVAYGTGGDVAPTSASDGSGGDKITFDFDLDFPQDTDPLIIYTNAMGYTSGTLTISSSDEISDPKAFAPSGAAVSATPEPSSLLLLGTGGLGMLAAMRRRFA